MNCYKLQYVIGNIKNKSDYNAIKRRCKIIAFENFCKCKIKRPWLSEDMYITFFEISESHSASLVAEFNKLIKLINQARKT